MAHINCEDCLKTYRPYRQGIALLRVLMYGFSDWWEFEDERDIEEQFNEHWCDNNHPHERWRLIQETRRYMRDDSFDRNFNFYYQYLENKRRKHILATFLCLDCEKYFCTNCVSKHSGHFTFSKDDKYDRSKCGTISVEILNNLKAEEDKKLENMKHEQTYLSDVLDVRCEDDKLGLANILYRHVLTWNGSDADERNKFNRLWLLDFLCYCHIQCLLILNDNTKWLVTDHKNNCIKIFNVNDNKMTRRIKLPVSLRPRGITEISTTNPSQSLIAVSLPNEGQIYIINIHTVPVQVVSCIKVQLSTILDVEGQGNDLQVAYCNDKLITWRERFTWREDYLDVVLCHSIHVMDMAGEIINIIDLNKLPGIKLKRFYPGCMSVHAESETVYVCHWRDPLCVISLSLDGQVLHSVTFTDLTPALIHVDKDQNIYVMSNHLPIYKLSADLKQRKKIIDEDIADTYSISAMRFHNGKFYLASDKGHVYIIQHE